MNSLKINNFRILNFTKYVVMIILAMILLIVPIPEYLVLIRPDFVVLVLIYLCWRWVDKVGVSMAFVVGLLIDTLTFGVLGQHALSKTVVAYGAIRIRNFASYAPIYMQSLLVLTLLILHAAIISLIGLYTNDGGSSLSLWVGSLSGAFIWLVLGAVKEFIGSNQNAAVK